MELIKLFNTSRIIKTKMEINKNEDTELIC